jgi:hypothetical protein
VRQCTVRHGASWQHDGIKALFLNTIMQVQTKTSDYRSLRTINPQHAPEVRFWAREFDVPPSKLIEMVREVGRNVGEIRRRFEQ